MSESLFLDNLKAFGLTGQEALIYEALLKHGDMTGYEVAKETGISRSNVYSALSALTEKGAAYLMESEATKYRPVPVKTFSENVLKELNRKAKELEELSPKQVETKEGYVTISGTKHIKNKISEMLKACDYRLYILAKAVLLKEYKEEIEALVREGKKIVVLSEEDIFENTIFYKTKPESGQLRFITDSSYVLTGTLEGKETDTCLYSGESNLVAVMKEALKNKMILIEMGKA